MKVIKQNVNGVTAFTFDKLSDKFLVKNFSENDITVSFSAEMPANETVTIKAGMGQVIFENEHLGCCAAYAHDTLYIDGSGEVEVQAICYTS